MNYVIAIDPGGTSGFALWTKDDPIVVNQFSFTTAGLYRFLQATMPDVIVCESFVYITKQSHADLIPVEMIGVIKMYAEVSQCRLVFQRPHIGKAFWTDDKIKAIGLWAKGKPHGCDALRHLLTYLTAQGNDTWINLLKEPSHELQ